VFKLPLLWERVGVRAILGQGIDKKNCLYLIPSLQPSPTGEGFKIEEYFTLEQAFRCA